MSSLGTISPLPVSSEPAGGSASISSLVPIPSVSDKGNTPDRNTGITKIVNIEYKNDVPNIYKIVVTTAGPAAGVDDAYHAVLSDSPSRLTFDINNSILALTSSNKILLGGIISNENNSVVSGIHWGPGSGGQIVLDLSRPIVYAVSTADLSDNSGIQYVLSIQETLPQSGPNNSITGKTVIVDAGHGGRDSGAVGSSKAICEKSYTLAIAKLLRDDLITAGAHPLMTRSDDTYISPDDRSQMDTLAHADYFISIHCDSSDVQNSRSGDTVYYHRNNAACRGLADSIANSLSQIEIPIKSDGTRSDFVRFPGVGFAVLRNCPETAVLVECGYVNNDSDAKCLANSVDQEQIAAGIAAGLQDYVANQ
jgi:N-acetylmuramoyl-L-alanine amidase